MKGATPRRRASPGARQVALLRGINVGRAKRVSMADLRAFFESLGYRDVRTLANSGNVVFTGRDDPKTAAARIENGLAGAVGFTARVTVLTAEELAEAIDGNPFDHATKDPARFLLAVLLDPADRRKVAPLEKSAWGREGLAIGTRVVYLWCADGILESRVADAVYRALGGGLTARNWATVCKLRNLLEASSDED